jgi:hypothetical protein
MFYGVWELFSNGAVAQLPLVVVLFGVHAVVTVAVDVAVRGDGEFFVVEIWRRRASEKCAYGLTDLNREIQKVCHGYRVVRSSGRCYCC